MSRTDALMVAPPAGGDRERKRSALLNAVLLSVAVALAAFIKRHYSNANADDLRWLLSPASRLVESISGQRFVHEARVGFVAAELRIVIAPACSGVNFLVIAFLTFAFGFVPRFSAAREKILWFSAAPLLAYAATLFANTARIAAAVALHESGLRAPLLSPAEVHRALGVVVYLAALWVLYALAEKMLRGTAS